MMTKTIEQTQVLRNGGWVDATTIKYRIFGILVMKKTLVYPKGMKDQMYFNF